MPAIDAIRNCLFAFAVLCQVPRNVFQHVCIGFGPVHNVKDIARMVHPDFYLAVYHIFGAGVNEFSIYILCNALVYQFPAWHLHYGVCSLECLRQ